MRLAKFLVVISCLSSVCVANEHEAPPTEHGAPEGGHGGATVPEATYSGKQSQQWSEVQTKLSALKAKVDAQEAVVKSLIPGGHPGVAAAAGGGHETAPPPAEHGAPAAAEGASGAAHSSGGSQFEKLKKEEEKLKSLTVEYNKLNSDYETKFPEKGTKENRIYKRLDPQSSEPAVKGPNVYEARQQQLQNKIFRQYPRSAQKIKKTKALVTIKKDPHATIESKGSKTDGAGGETKHGETKSSLPAGDVTEQIILKK